MSLTSDPPIPAPTEKSSWSVPPELHDALESGVEAKNYYAWMMDTFVPYLGGTVIEHGAGAGSLAAVLLESGVSPLILDEPDDRLVAVLRKRFQGRKDVTIFEGTLDNYLTKMGPASVDAIVSSNVLEHIEDDEGCLATMRKLIRPGGRVVIYVPARPELYSNFDRLIGHHRRYRKRELQAKLLAAGLEIERLQYRNLVATLPWLWMRLTSRSHVTGSNVRLYDRYVFPVMCALENVVSPPYGLNLLAVGS